MNIGLIMFKCLIYTVISEVILSIILGIRNKKDIINIILINIATNVLVTSIPIYFNIIYGKIYRDISLLILEILTLFIEGYTYKKVLNYRKINPYLLSLILNGCSYLLGLIII